MKDLKDYIIEGAWGYEPSQNDSTLDMRGEMNVGILEYIYDECFKRVWSNDEGITIDGNSAWDVIGIIEYYFERCTFLFDIGSPTDPKQKEYEKYYYWWKLKENKKKDIVDIYDQALSICSGSEEFINSWKEPETMRKSIKKRADNLKRYAILRDEYFKNEIENEKKRNMDTVNRVKNPQYSSFKKDEECNGVALTPGDTVEETD